jgi:hypothetical protein
MSPKAKGSPCSSKPLSHTRGTLNLASPSGPEVPFADVTLRVDYPILLDV